MEGGARVPYILELDQQLTFIAEYRDKVDTTNGKPARPPRQATPANDLAHTIAKWATKSVEENPIPGTDHIREEYFADLERKIEAFAEQNKSCPGCEVGRLMRNYRKRLAAEGFIDDV
jgi:ribosomal protein S27AE